MSDFKVFIANNQIKKKDLADYLGVSAAFITQLCQGLRGLPSDKLALLKRNDRGWDTSALTEPSCDVNIGSWNKGNAHVNMSVGAENAMKIALLEQENAQLKERLKDKDEEIAFLKSLLQK